MTSPVNLPDKPCQLPKDPAKHTTDEFYTTCNLPARWQRPYWFTGYGSQQTPPPHPFYRSSYMEIGWYPPNVHTVPVSYYPTQQKFSRHLATCGMYRNSSLNTALDPQPWTS
ncbi:UNVERIFIED_CONTAM: hypothetical protein PYX00_005028 [Menopon gallinae]|uniref:Uncharacterized protein n=1 Tax=Menopon gallinae TaxID=328185 RepID=A0AAW2I805_9NEOP